LKNFTKFILNYATVIFNTLVIGVLFWYFDKDDTINIAWFMIVFVLGGVAVIFLCEILWNNKFHKNISQLPKLRHLINEGTYIIFTPSNLFSSQTCVSLYYSDDYDKLVALGYVDTVIETSKNLQVKIIEFANGVDIDFIKQNKSNILLKPTIPYNPYIMI
jgi:hypothetical protein